LRIDLPHVPQHVVQRGNDRRPCFFQPIDRLRYLDDLREISRRAGCAVHAYVLTTNHVHLRVTPTAPGQVGHVMQALGRRYVRYVNDRYRRTGTLWEGRYESCPVENDAHLMRCHRHIELNPVRARWWLTALIIPTAAAAPMRSACKIRYSRKLPRRADIS
jgi:putative transposase